MGFNLAGLVVPAVAALVAIPLLVAGLGTDRFALLTLVWVIAGQASVFDLGIGRALTHTVAERIGAGRHGEVRGLVGVALLAVGGAGLLAGAGLYAGASALALDVLQVPVGMEREAASGFRMLAFALPAITMTSALRGVLEAYQRFDISTLIRVPTGAWAVLGPLAVLPFTQRFDVIVGVLVAGRLLGALAYAAAAVQSTPAVWPFALDGSAIRELTRYGSWMSGATLLNAALEYGSRFLIGAALPVAAVAYFSTPADLSARMLMIPAALVGVLLPSLSATLVRDRALGTAMIGRSAQAVFALMAPVALGVVAFAPEALAWWIDPSFAAEASVALQWLAVATLLNGIATVPATSLVSIGRPDMTALPLLVELPLFFAATWYVLDAGYGVAGVAAAYTLRIGLDLLLMSGLSAWLVRGTGPPLGKVILAALAISAACFGIAQVASPVHRAGLVLLMTLLGGLATWTLLLARADRNSLRGLLSAASLRRLLPPGSQSR